jgi:transposase, IS5 family
LRLQAKRAVSLFPLPQCFAFI